ncbi:MAG: 1-deoxy-D-xylulose-5-phosphate reductoisomerase [Gemmatimonadales bacterium]|nr:MAG: 1-deoxy-D-xylulose-5-phosphate reductoisomerase [Gemmatimonadales bacterium]
MIRVAILGSTGSIGESALKVMERHPDRFEVVALAANRSVRELEDQARRFRPLRVVVADEEAFEACRDNGTHWSGGREALVDAASMPEADVVLNALVGFAGLEPSIAALRAGKRLALANKESLVTGGDLLMEAMEDGEGELIPVDSEHSAILQCLGGEDPDQIQRLVITASGGPFRGWSRERLAAVGPEDALRHPTWDMGAKITIDSATLANKALEVIEAHVLYGIPYDRIDAVVHPQSVVHSFVEFVDGSVMAQLGFPTMELPILYALTYPDRLDDPDLRTFDPVRASPLTFEAVDTDAFPLFRIGVEAGRTGGTAPTVFNAANEVAVDAFLRGKVDFPGMAQVVEEALSRTEVRPVTELEVILEADRAARRSAIDSVARRTPAGN